MKYILPWAASCSFVHTYLSDSQWTWQDEEQQCTDDKLGKETKARTVDACFFLSIFNEKCSNGS